MFLMYVPTVLRVLSECPPVALRVPSGVSSGSPFPGKFPARPSFPRFEMRTPPVLHDQLGQLRWFTGLVPNLGFTVFAGKLGWSWPGAQEAVGPKREPSGVSALLISIRSVSYQFHSNFQPGGSSP